MAIKTATAPKTEYDVGSPFWHKGRFVRAGETLSLTEAEAKYLFDVVKKKPADATPAAIAAADAAVNAPAADAAKV